MDLGPPYGLKYQMGTTHLAKYKFNMQYMYILTFGEDADLLIRLGLFLSRDVTTDIGFEDPVTDLTSFRDALPGKISLFSEQLFSSVVDGRLWFIFSFSLNSCH